MAQIGTIRLETQNSGTVSVPVFDVGDAGSDVYDFVRVDTASGTGFIPLVDTGTASFPYIRVQSQNNGVVAVHNEASLSEVIYDYEDNTVPTTSEQTSNNIDTVSTSQNGNPSLEGTYMLYTYNRNGNNENWTWDLPSGSTSQPSHVRFYMMEENMSGTAERHVIRLGETTSLDNSAFNVVIDERETNIRINWNGTANPGYDTGVAYNLETSYRIDIYNIDWNNKEFDADINGNNVATNLSFNDGSTNSIGALLISTSGTGSMDSYFDYLAYL